MLVRLIGIATSVGGVTWDPPDDERAAARRFLLYLASQQVLCEPYDREIAPFIVRSVAAIRDRMTRDLEGLADSVLREALRATSAACRKFLDENQSARSGYGAPYEAQLHSTLGEFRALLGIHTARAACAYDLEVDPHLEPILPPIEDEPGGGEVSSDASGEP